MKVRLSFTIKILLPYLVLALLFLLIFLGVLQKGNKGLVYLSAAGMGLSLVFGILHNYWLKRPLIRVSRLVSELTKGNIPIFREPKVADEIGELEMGLARHVANLKDMAAFSRSMSTGDFTGHYKKLSSEDELGDALNKLKISLMESIKEGEDRRNAEENRTWSAQGLAKFSSLFREAEDNLTDLSTLLMRELVSYTEADVGALFITRGEGSEEVPYLEVSGSYAFDREKQIDRTFKFGEGLVGRAAMEKELIYISDLPPDYMKIRSGLGEDAPSSILLVPVLLDQQVMGVMELASLGEMPSHHIEFISQLADALATTLAKVKANLQNRKLFEQTKKQAEELSSQEKVFKEDMVQLEKALERSVDKEAELIKELEQLRRELP
ncbi:MAG: GAF domain-containing protein [Bacteroidota bacterium]|nr:GAF domain-containing protein [Bacteroidota bacterium]